MSWRRWGLATMTLTLWPAIVPPRQDPEFDVVVLGGRVIDPESGLDATRNVGVRAGRIAAVTESRIRGKREIDARGLVVAPGFIDLHEHGQTAEAYALMVRDGVTSAFELELGTANVERWYSERASGQLVNHGVAIGHIPARVAAMGDTGEFNLTGRGVRDRASDEQIAEIARRIGNGLDQGAVAVGYIPSYTPGATGAELEATFRAAAQRGATVHIHVWERAGGLRETLDLAQRAGVALHVVHANSSGQADPAGFLQLITDAWAQGQDVTTEAYPYEAGMSSIQAPSADNWRTWPDTSFAKFEWVETGERLTRETWGRYRERGGAVIIHARTEAMTHVAIASPLTMIASDGLFGNGRGHPRTSGTYAKVLGRYVREKRALSLTDAIRKMTIAPARRLEARVPAMRAKGRIQVGADADLTLFDPETVIDRSTYRDPTIPSQGIPYVLVNGVVVVDRGELIRDARPGRGIRATAASSLRPAGDTIRQYQLARDGDRPRLVIKAVERPVPGERQVLIRVRAVSLNRRDLYVLRSARPGLVPISDGAGEVIAVGPGVTRFRIGDRVAATFFANWISGKRTGQVNGSARGGAIDGMLSEMVVSHEDGLVPIPEHLTFEEAATLPCAALTAWTALFTHGRLERDDFVLLEGTGGVSTFGLQLAVAAGARAIITSSSDAKLERARALGAFGTINYRTNPEWQNQVRTLTANAGVAQVLEVGGQETLPRALQALAPGGHIALIGGLTGFVQTMAVDRLIGLGAAVTGIYVGSRADFEAMNAFLTRHRLKPIIDRVFRFEEAQAAYTYMESDAHLGKIVIAW